jgi:hypothetical protein
MQVLEHIMTERIFGQSVDLRRQVGFYGERISALQQDGQTNRAMAARAAHWFIYGALTGEVELEAVADLVRAYEGLQIRDELTGAVALLGSLEQGAYASEGGVHSFRLEQEGGERVVLTLGANAQPNFDLVVA